jgi:predicted DNA-binding transcriptional regulator AlpA
MESPEQLPRLMRWSQVFGKAGLIPVDKSTGWNWVRQGKFPAPVHIPGAGRTVTAFRERDVMDWLRALPQGFGKPLDPAACTARRENASRRRATSAEEANGNATEAKPRPVLQRRASSRSGVEAE